MCILDHLQLRHPDVYERLESYTIMDSSPTLLDLMYKMLVKNDQLITTQGSNRHFGKVKLKQVDMIDIGEKRLVKILKNIVD